MLDRHWFVKAGWTARDYLRRVWDASEEDNLFFLASGIAFNINGPSRNVEFVDQPGHAVSNHASLAAARASQDQQGSFGVLRRFPLPWV